MYRTASIGLLAVAVGWGPGSATLEGQGAPAGSTYDRIWGLAEWYANDQNPVVQRVLFTGRYQHDYTALDADQGSHDEWNVRRLRLGVRIGLLRDFTLHGEVELNPQEADPVYERLTDVYVEWSRGGELAVTAGKQGVPFTMDGSTSSKELLALERSTLNSNLWFPYEYLPGVSVSGERAPWVYHTGLFSAGGETREFGDFRGDVFWFALLGYDFATRLGVPEALLRGNYVYQPPDADNTFTRPLQHVVSANFSLDAGGWGVRTDLSAGAGYGGQSDVWGATAMPYLDVTDKVQLVAQYTLVKSSDPNGVRLATYESSVVSGRGDRYQQGYLGANYYFYGHKLKLQTGVQLADMRDRAGDGGAYSGFAWTMGLRVSW